MTWETSAQIRRVLTVKCASEGIPVSGTFELTPRCNLACRMCYVRLTPEQMAPLGRERTAGEWLELAAQAKKEGLTFLLLTGGEPTLRADFPEIYEGLAQMGFSISINSNGTLFHQEIRKLMHRLPPAQVNITVYGLSKEEYGILCDNPDAYSQMMDTLDWLREESILTHLNTTIIPGNLERWKLFEEFARKRELELRMTAYCFPPVRRNECEEFDRLPPETAGELIVKDMLYREGLEAVRKREKDLQQPLNNCKLDLGDPMQCMAARSQFWINWNGSMTPCGMLKYPVSAPFETGFAGAWEELREQTEAVRLCPACTSCPEQRTCMNCAAVTFTETGRFDGKPEYMCRMNYAYREALKKYAGRT